MNRNKIFLFTVVLFLIVIASSSCNKTYKYTTVPNDPLNARIYTLDNGLKVYLTVNDAEPRIQTYIAVKVGGKNDPSETTGLAHYFEHLMFKGTEQLGTQNYTLEKPILDEIEKEFESYRKLTDSTARVKSYAKIDSLSYEASKIAIPNEYDKVMAAIGAKGTNAYTGMDMTVYVENIPSNQVENWAKIQSDRFKNNVIRGFHTELETVYEEKNMSLTKDSRKAVEQMFANLFPNHPYGQQTVLGTQEHLKNPSITNIKNYYKEWYVPNNIAICVSGDFNPDEMIRIVDKYFGDMKPNPNLKHLNFDKNYQITEPIVKDVYGLEAPFVIMAWGFPGQNSAQNDTLTLLSQILFNGSAGLIDLNINQSQKTLGSYAFPYSQADYTALILQGMPKSGQTNAQVKDILLEQINILKQGNFDEELIIATINNFKKDMMKGLENNSSRADAFVQAFINDIEWEDFVTLVDRLEKINKQGIVDFANKYLTKNYVTINKIQEKDNNVQKIDKPKITPIFTNRDTSSNFLKSIQSIAVTPIEPVFLDYNKDLAKLAAKQDIQVLYKQNTTNSLFSLTYLFKTGSYANKMLETAASYSYYLGTSKYSPEQIKQMFYKLACEYSINVSGDQTTISLNGLNQNMNAAIELLEEIITDLQPNEAVLANLKKDILQGRINAKSNQNANFSRLGNYVQFGPNNPSTFILSNKEIEALKSSQLISSIKELLSYDHTVLYYGPLSETDFINTFNNEHKIVEKLTPAPQGVTFNYVKTTENKVFIAPYDAKQIYMFSFSNTGETFNKDNSPIIRMYSEYFGGGMNSIVFQEMREARGLAYSARATYNLGAPNTKDAPYIYSSFIATQNDKMMDAINAFNEIINNMPQSEAAFNIAKEGMLSKIRTDRVLKENVLWNYIYKVEKLGLTQDDRIELFNKVSDMTLQDVVKFQEDVIKGRKYHIGILGDETDLDLKTLGNGEFGGIVKLSTKDIFGY